MVRVLILMQRRAVSSAMMWQVLSSSVISSAAAASGQGKLSCFPMVVITKEPSIIGGSFTDPHKKGESSMDSRTITIIIPNDALDVPFGHAQTLGQAIRSKTDDRMWVGNCAEYSVTVEDLDPAASHFTAFTSFCEENRFLMMSGVSRPVMPARNPMGIPAATGRMIPTSPSRKSTKR